MKGVLHRAVYLMIIGLAMSARAQPLPPASSGLIGTAASLFVDFCLSRPPTFEDLGRRADAAGYTVFLDRSIPGGNGQFIKQKNWVVAGPSGQFLLTSEDANGPDHAIGCGIFVAGASGQEMEQALSSDPHLDVPAKHFETNGGYGVTWQAHILRTPSEDAQVMLAYGMQGLQGAAVNLIYRVHSDARQ